MLQLAIVSIFKHKAPGVGLEPTSPEGHQLARQ
jgi:hypothetical protein